MEALDEALAALAISGELASFVLGLMSPNDPAALRKQRPQWRCGFDPSRESVNGSVAGP